MRSIEDDSSRERRMAALQPAAAGRDSRTGSKGRSPGRKPAEPPPIRPRRRGIAILAVLLTLCGTMRRGNAEAAGPRQGLLERCASQSRTLEAAFARIDRDGDGLLSPDEWGSLIRQPAEMPVDLDGDGQISRPEFASSFLRPRQPRSLEGSRSSGERLWVGRRLLEAGDCEAACRIYREIASDVPESFEALLGLGRSLARCGELPAARRAFQAAAGQNPGDAGVWFDLAATEVELGLAVEGSAHLTRGLTILSSWRAIDGWQAGDATLRTLPRRHLDDLARRLERLPDGSGLAAVVSRWRLRNPWVEVVDPEPAPDPMHRAVLKFALQGWYREALEAAGRELLVMPADSWLHLARASLLLVLGDPSAAAAATDEAERHGAPAPSVAAMRIALALAAGDRVEAVQHLGTLQPERLTLAQVVEVGWSLAYRGEWGQLYAWASLAAPAIRQRPELNLLLGVGRVSKGEEGLADDLMALQLQRNQEPAWLRLEAQLLIDQGRAEQAHVLATLAEAKEPRDPRNHLLLWKALQASGDIPGGLHALETAWAVVEIRAPAWPELALTLAGVYLRQRFILSGVDRLRALADEAGAGLSGQLSQVLMERPRWDRSELLERYGAVVDYLLAEVVFGLSRGTRALLAPRAIEALAFGLVPWAPCLEALRAHLRPPGGPPGVRTRARRGEPFSRPARPPVHGWPGAR